MDRERYASGTEWESTVGYSRAIRAGNEIHVSGTTATDDDGQVVAPGDPHAQTVRAIENVETALSALDAALSDVVRTRLFVTDIDDWEAIGRAHGDAFADVRPATTMVQVERLIDPEMLVEVEAVARD
ncbi:RidA family protein [Haloplanus rubicundus]|uniref:RidA family protein n=1 Tax=Haloplanus rubicundus TaxID=1547898 RepID=A0A345E642_9EURY|nr:RidA family protein [Haloplanus rubicundus]AXG07664.1 RidA family protein [Haloplanus rubicundus]AXG11082.1 RidA family protein [Haloplanus rubicundus]